MSIYDDLLKTAHLVEARGNALADELIATLEASRLQIVGKLAELQARYLTGAVWDAESFARRKAFLEAQRAEVDRLIGEVYASMARPMTEAAQDAMNYAAAATSRSFASLAAPGLTIGEGATVLSLATVAEWMTVHTVDGLVLTEWLASMAKSSADRIVAAGREAMIQGLSVQNTARLLRQKGIEGGIPALEALSRTFLLSASNYANEQTFERQSDIVRELRYNAVLDGRTCAICGADDGKLYPLKGERPKLPRHISCRCLYSPVVDWKGLGLPELENNQRNRPAVKHDERTVHHRDGTTSTRFKIPEGGVEHTGENYSQWIARQVKEDPDFARRALGKTRFELLRDGKITLEKMVVDGRIKRLSEIK